MQVQMRQPLTPGDTIIATTLFDENPHVFRVVVVMYEGEPHIALVTASGEHADEVRPVDWLLETYGDDYYEQLFLPVAR